MDKNWGGVDHRMSSDMRFSAMWYVRPEKAQISLRIHKYSMSAKLLTEHHLEFQSLKRSLIRAFACRLNILGVLSYSSNMIWSF